MRDLEARESTDPYGVETMRAAFYETRGSLDNLYVGVRPKPVPAPGEVLIEVRAAAVGMWDVNVMLGTFGTPPLPMIPGCEVAGVVEEGSGTHFQPGDEVYAFLGFESGGFAEYATAPAEAVRPKPDGISPAEAAALVVSAGTAHEGLVDRAQLRKGETVIVTAASGGVGTAAVQIAAGVGARVLAVASARNHPYVRSLGASETFDYNDPDWISRLKTSVPEGVDVLFDGAGDETRDRALQAVRKRGRGVFIVGAGPQVPPDIETHEFSANITGDRLDVLRRLVEAGTLKAHIETQVPLERARKAMAHVGSQHTRGRIVLTIR